MSTVETTLQQVETVSRQALYRKSRVAMMGIAFWHTLRRDIMVTFREFVPFLMQALISPFSLLLVFGRVLPGMGTMTQIYPAVFFPGVVAFTIFMASLLGITLSLMVDLDYAREIDDRLLAPIPVGLVALEKVIFSALRSLVAAGLIFLLAYWVMGSGFQVRTDDLALMIGIMVLYALSSSALGLVIGAALPADKLYMLFSLIFSITMYTGCVYFSWNGIGSIKVFQIMTLLNPLSYAAEGLRYAMVPATNGHAFVTLPIGWALAGLCVSFVLFLWLGMRIFHKRVIS